MISPKCDKCGKELRAYGGLAFSPPENTKMKVQKLHICVGCWESFLRWIKRKE